MSQRRHVGYGCDAVAVTSDDATRFNYLRELSWALEGTGVEMLVDPGLVEVAGPRMHIRPLMGVPLLHIEEPHFTGWRRLFKRTFDVVLDTPSGSSSSLRCCWPSPLRSSCRTVDR